MVRKLLTTEADRREFIRLLQEHSLDRPLVAEFRIFRKNRSLRQNALFWMWMRCIADETGNDVDTLHNHFCTKYLGWYGCEVMGEYHRKVPGTKNLDTKEFDEFLENIRIDMMNNQNIILPDPEDQGWDEFYTKYGKE